MRLHFLSAACAVILVFLSGIIVANKAGSAAQASSLSIVRITPSGSDVPAGRQIVFQFDRPVVPVGRMERGQSESDKFEETTTVRFIVK